MSDTTSDSSADYVLLTRLADEFAARFRAGERPSLQEYIDRHPELAEDIREMLPAMVEIERVTEDYQGAAEQAAAPAPPAFRQLGDFRILRLVGRGGMGIVYEAEQESLGRRVALKVLSAGTLADPKQVRRFEREARAAARLHHTNIVPVFGAGCQDGHHYFVMQFIAGLGLDSVLEDLRRLRRAKSESGPAAGPMPAARPAAVPTAAEVALSLIAGRFDAEGRPFDGTATESFDGEATATVPANGALPDTPGPAAPPGSSELSASSGPDRRFHRSVARIGIQAAEAMEYANRQGVLHRDIKPSNLLLDNRGNVWVADFGLAKTAEDDVLTHSGDILGTIRYMAPERFSGRCDVRSDVYSLGLTLYELLALRPAYEATDRHALIDRVLHEEPERLKKLAPEVPRDLETIIAKAIARDPAARYATAGALAEDLQRFVEDRPIRARRVSSVERLARWCRRNPRLALSIGLAAVGLVAAAVASLLYAGQQAQLATARRLYAEEQTRRLDEQARANERITDLAGNLAKEGAALKEERARLKAALAESNRRLSMLNYQRGQAAFEKGQIGPGMLWMAETFRSAAEAEDPVWQHAASTNLAAWRIRHPRLRAVFSHRNPVSRVAFSPDGKIILCAAGLTARLWDAITGLPIGPPLEHPRGTVMAVAFSLDGKTAFTECLGQTTHRWDATTGQPIGPPLAHPGFYAFAFSPDCKTALTVKIDDSRITRLWDLTSNQPIGPPTEQQGFFLDAVFSPDNRTVRIVFRTVNRRVLTQIRDAATGRSLGEPLEYRGANRILAFSHDGRTFLGVSDLRTAHICSAATGERIGRALVHRDRVSSGAFSPDGQTVLTGAADGTARLWDIASGRPLGEPMPHRDEVSAVALSPDGQTILTGGADKTARLWVADTVQPLGKPLDITRRDVFLLQGVAFGPDGKTIRSCNYGGTSRLWDLATGRAVGEPLRHPGWVTAVAFSPDGKAVLTAGEGNIGRLWDAGTGRVVGKPLPLGMVTFAVALSPDGKTVFAGNRLWDATTGQPIGEFLGNGQAIWSAAFSPDGRVVLTASEDRTARRWDSATGRPIGEPIEHQGSVRAVAYSRDGRTMCTGSDDKTASLWDAASGRPIGGLLEHQGGVRAVAFSPDGRFVLTGSVDRTARLWDAATGAPIGPPMEHRAEVTAVAFSPDGKTILTASPHSATTLEGYGAVLWIWQTPSPLHADPRRIAAWAEAATGLELDRQGSVRSLDNATWRQRREQLYQSGGPPATDPAQRLDPILFGPDPAARADGLMNLGREAEAEAAYAEAIRVRPLNRSLWNARGRFDLSCGRPERAAAHFAEAVRLWPDDFFLHQRLCLALLAAGDSPGLKRAVSRLLERFGNPSDADEAGRVASTCVLAPDAVDPEIPIRLARTAVEQASAQNKAFPMATLGAALYRAGRFEDAIRSLEGGRSFRDAWPFLAMAHARLGHGEEGRRWLGRLRNELAKAPGTDAADDDLTKVESGLWRYFGELKIRLLLSEAEAVALYDPAFPDDPFAR